MHEERIAELEQQVASARAAQDAAQSKAADTEQRCARDASRIQELEATLKCASALAPPHWIRRTAPSCVHPCRRTSRRSRSLYRDRFVITLCRRVQATLKERDDMLKEVETGMDQVKELYGRKVDRVERERRAALAHCEDLQRQTDRAEAAAKEAREHSQQANAEAEKCRERAVAEAERLAAAARAADARVHEVEMEMRALLEAFEKERAATAAKAAQLQEVIKAWQQ